MIQVRKLKLFKVWTLKNINQAGPGFDGVMDFGDHSLAAQNVQCIHTNSGGYGTTTRNCSQNWWMGICGVAQVGK